MLCTTNSEFARNAKKTIETVCKEASSNDFFNALHNKFTKKHDGQRLQSLKAYREDSNNIMQSLAKASVVVSWIKNYWCWVFQQNQRLSSGDRLNCQQVPKVYCLFKLFCLKDRVFNAFIRRIMDDVSLLLIDFMSRFEKLQIMNPLFYILI